MSLQADIERHIALLEQGQILEAMDQFLADYGVMYANGAVFGEGLHDCMARQMPFMQSVTQLTCTISGLFVDTFSEFCVFKNFVSYSGAEGLPHTVDGLHIQMWAGGKIASEWYFSGDNMADIIAAGILADPAHILELL
ncbi:hypothetical protein [Kordiimonas pumila]|uniref:SnoaL-like domain-containing protein n=1 Tax=Kordiimonas pumila TaxID=2161677 RepID=A0ABV7D7K1_9PROT|nr:hypothetical protein [Kordiimonas pumila]